MAIVAIEAAVVGSNSTIGLRLDFSIIAVGYYFPFVLLQHPLVGSGYLNSIKLNSKLISELLTVFIELYELFKIFSLVNLFPLFLFLNFCSV